MNSVFWIFLGFLSVTKCNDETWDFLIFTQRWPITACTDWEDHSKNNTCVLPKLDNIWTIHGIWPTKLGTKGPWNCNASWHFDDNLINPIKLELEEYWTNIEGNTQLNSLWKHEWVKHGTCAATLSFLDNELKYFSQALQWIKKFNMKDVLPLKQIKPRPEGYAVQDVFNCVDLGLTKKPIVQCIIEKHTKQMLLSEIRICFDKQLNLIDCDAVKDFGDFDVVGDVLTNCDVNKPLIYPDSVVSYTSTPGSTISTSESSLTALYRTREKLYSIYNILKLLMWFSY